MTATDHARILGIIYLIFGVLGILAMIVGLIFLVGMGGLALFNSGSGDSVPIVVMLLIFGVAILFSGIFIIPQLIAGWSLFKGTGRSKIMVIVSGVLNVLNFPIGTAIGVYTFWFVFGDEGKRYFRN